MKIKPLTKENVNEAVSLTLRIFNNKPTEFDYPGKWMPASLDPKNNKEVYASFNVKYLKYWVAVEDDKIVGTTGIYTIKEDEKEAAWLAWFCVDSNYRHKGIGHRLVDFIIDKAKKKHKKYLRLYTTANPAQDEARELYLKKGFKITKEEYHPDTKEKMVYMELKL